MVRLGDELWKLVVLSRVSCGDGIFSEVGV